MWNSPSRVTPDGTQYSFKDIECLIDVVGVNIETFGNSEPILNLVKDNVCEFHGIYFLDGITNGEYIYGIYEIFRDLLNDCPYSVVPLYKEAILYSIICDLREGFMEEVFPRRREDSEYFLARAKSIWNLYLASRINEGEPVWKKYSEDYEEGEEVEPPTLMEIDEDGWSWIFESILDEFFWDRDWEMFRNFSLEFEQPHYPTLPEYRRALKWLEYLFSKTEGNMSGREGGLSMVTHPLLPNV